MDVRVFAGKGALATAAAQQAAAAIRRAVEDRGIARLVAATGTSQLEFLEVLVATPRLPWDRVELFHLDEYIGLPETDPASFRRYLLDRLVEPTGVELFHGLDGMADPETVCEEVGRRLTAAPIDVAFVGIGENAHLAFNDPPADFDSDRPYIVVALDEACRRQQVGEGWFPDVSSVPKRAITMSCPQILKAREIIVVVPDRRKAEAVRATCDDEITPQVPASILRTHPHVTVYLDEESASRLASRPPTESAPARVR